MRDLEGKGGQKKRGGGCRGGGNWGAVVLLGLGLLLGLLGGRLHLRVQTGEGSIKKNISFVGTEAENEAASPRRLTSLVLASPFSEWFSSLASASAFSFAFLVFLSSFLSLTAFSFC